MTKNNSVLRDKRIQTMDGIFHRPYDTDGSGLVLVCDLSDRSVKYIELRRFGWLDLWNETTTTTCLGCLAAVEQEVDER